MTVLRRGGAARFVQSHKGAIAGLTAFVVALLLAVWIISPRFGIWGPSVVDDWSAIDNAPGALHQLSHLAYDPEKVHDPYRYRPGYTAVWNSLLWHTLGAPKGLTGPNIWNLLKLALFVGALVLVTVSVAGFSPRRTIGPVWLGALAAAPPAMVVATPLSGEDFARFGPGEPLLVAGMTLGCLVLAFATGRLVRVKGRSFQRQTLLLLGLAAVGYALWLLGVYAKEASVCFLVLAPFLYLFLARRWRESGVIEKPLFRYRSFQVVAILMLLPVFHMAFEILKLAGEGTTVYGAPVPTGTGGALQRLRPAFDLQWRSMTQLLGTSFWRSISLVTLLLPLWIMFRQRRVPWLEIGLIAAGWAVLVFQGLSGAATARYYIPTMALFSLGIALLVAKSTVWPRLVAVIAAAIFISVNIGGSRERVTAWAGGDKDANQAVELVANLNPGSCPVYMSGLEEEVADAFPELVALREPFPPGACGKRFQAFMLRRQQPERITPVTNELIMRACSGGWVPYQDTAVWRIMACGKLARGVIQGQAISDILEQDRLVPGQRFSERKRLLASVSRSNEPARTRAARSRQQHGKHVALEAPLQLLARVRLEQGSRLRAVAATLVLRQRERRTQRRGKRGRRAVF